MKKTIRFGGVDVPAPKYDVGDRVKAYGNLGSIGMKMYREYEQTWVYAVNFFYPRISRKWVNEDSLRKLKPIRVNESKKIRSKKGKTFTRKKHSRKKPRRKK